MDEWKKAHPATDNGFIGNHTNGKSDSIIPADAPTDDPWPEFPDVPSDPNVDPIPEPVKPHGNDDHKHHHRHGNDGKDDFDPDMQEIDESFVNAFVTAIFWACFCIVSIKCCIGCCYYKDKKCKRQAARLLSLQKNQTGVIVDPARLGLNQRIISAQSVNSANAPVVAQPVLVYQPPQAQRYVQQPMIVNAYPVKV